MPKRYMMDRWGRINLCEAKKPGIYPCIHLPEYGWADYNEESKLQFQQKYQSVIIEKMKETAKRNPKIQNELLKSTSDTLVEKAQAGNHSILMQGATGIGKSAIMTSVAFDLCVDEKKQTIAYPIYVVPRTDLTNQMEIHGAFGHFVTYQKLERWNAGKSQLDFKPEESPLIIYDECHRMLADEWFGACKKLESKMPDDHIKMGFTATPERADGKNALNSFECLGAKISVEDAYEAHLYKNPPKYITPKMDQRMYDDLNKWRSKIQKDVKIFDSTKTKLLKRIDDLLQSNPNPQLEEESIIQESIVEIQKIHPNEGVKILVFAKNQTELSILKSQYDPMLESMVGKEHLQSGEYISETSKSGMEFFHKFTHPKEKVQKGDIQILYSIDMFNEGIHVNNLDIAIKKRKTESWVVDQQQNGRMMGNRDHPGIILDFGGGLREVDNETDWERLDRCTRTDPYYGNVQTLDNRGKDLAKERDAILANYWDNRSTPYIYYKEKVLEIPEFAEVIRGNNPKIKANRWIKKNLKEHDAEWMSENRFLIQYEP